MTLLTLPSWLPAWIAQLDAYAFIAAMANITLAALGAVVAIYEHWAKKHRDALLIAFVAAGCLGAVAAVVSSAKATQDLKDANGRVDKAIAEVSGNMNGGDSFCYAMLESAEPKLSNIKLWIVHRGKFRLHDVSLYLYDSQKAMNLGFRAMATGHFDQQAMAAQSTRLVQLPPLSVNHFNEVDLHYQPDPGNFHKLNISFEGPTGEWTEVLCLALVQGRWVEAIRVFKPHPYETDEPQSFNEWMKNVEEKAA